MRKANKIVAIAFVILLSVTVTVYFYPRQNTVANGRILITGAVSNPENLTESQIEAFSHVTVWVTLSSSFHPLDNGTFSYTGVELRVLLDQAEILPNATSVFIQAPDGYAVSLPIQEAQKSTTILAYEKDGKPMTPLSTGGEGPIRLVISDQGAPHDWVKGVSLIEVQ